MEETRVRGGFSGEAEREAGLGELGESGLLQENMEREKKNITKESRSGHWKVFPSISYLDLTLNMLNFILFYKNKFAR